MLINFLYYNVTTHLTIDYRALVIKGGSTNTLTDEIKALNFVRDTLDKPLNPKPAV
jgi:hypothetical protein